jgi:catechol 2,3-dioxygenase-like lactoylglutathione lyase family enzyme
MAAFGRRTMVGLLSAGAWAARNGGAAAEPQLHFSALDHIEISVPDSARSAAFYARVFGGSRWKNKQTAKRYVKLGPCYIAIDQKAEAARVDHFSAGITGYNIGNLHSYLGERGIAYRDFPSGRDLNVSDPEGIRMQLSSENSWAPLEGTTALRETGDLSGEPIFQATGMDHILLNVADPERSAVFYEKIFGSVAQRNNHRIWFQTGRSRIGLLQTPDGQKSGVNHFCVAAAAFEYGVVIKKLEEAGARVEAPEVAGAPEFRDPDGFLVQVMTPRA